MPESCSWVCKYAIAQIGRPYWFNTAGEIADEDVYRKYPLASGYSYSNYQEQFGQKVHDCSGLILGALTCDNFNDPPVRPCHKLEHSATAQYNSCQTKGSMVTFPRIPGVLLFRTEGKYKKHTGIYIGRLRTTDEREFDDAVVDARNHAKGVVVNSIKDYSWDSWAMLSFLEKDTNRNTQFDAREIVGPPQNTLGTPLINQKFEIDKDKLTPYIATIKAGHNPTIDYDRIKQAKISGMMFYGGALFDKGHTKNAHYVNSYLDTQVKNCNTAGMPYALYVYVRARNVIEADEECRALYYIISRYPPKLGIWLSLQTDATIKTVNDEILEVYYKYIYKWGLGAKCGLYLTPKQLEVITWNSFKDRFYLWMIDSMNVSEVDNSLLTPEMFEVPD